MENYKTRVYNPETFEATEIETKIPNILVESVKSGLVNLNDIFITPTAINPDDLSVSIGILDKDKENRHHLKYRVTISVIE